MTHLDEPIRHLNPDSQASSELRKMLEAARRDGPDAHEMARMLSHLTPNAAPLSNTVPASSGIALSSVAKIGALILVAAVAVITYKGFIDGHSDSSVETANPLPRPLEQKIENPKPPATPLPQESAVTTPDRYAVSPPTRTKKQSRPTAKKGAMVARSNATYPADTNRELALLREARKALPHAASRALMLTERHRTDYPRGVFEQEREAIAIESLLRIGYKTRAQSRAERFLARFPDSAYRHRIEMLFSREKNFEKSPDQLSPIK